MAMLFAGFAAAAEISEFKLVPENPALDDGTFYMKAGLKGDTCETKIAFLLDGKEFLTRNLDCGTTTQSSSTLTVDENSCGLHTASVEVTWGGTILSSASKEFRIGNVPVMKVSPERPNLNKEVTLSLSDKDGNKLSGIDIEVWFDNDRKESRNTNRDGVFSFTPTTYGRYELRIDDPVYCGTMEVYVKRALIVDGPRPSNPMVGEIISMAVPGGVGVKVLYANCTPCMFPKTTTVGGVNFTIDEPGTYILMIGENNLQYWGINKTLVVSAKGAINVAFSPENQVIGKPLTISFTSGGTPVIEADVKLTRPDGVIEPYKTRSTGTIVIAPQMVGEYTLTIQKEKLETTTKRFEPKNSFSVQMPQATVAGQNATINVRDQYASAIVNAQIFINGAVEGMTDSGGNFVTDFGKAGANKLAVTKDTYWDYAAEVNVSGVMEIVAPAESELGETVAVSTRDPGGNTVESTIEITKPDGNKDNISGSFVPAAAGIYKITAVKTDYKTAEITINVNPHPLNLSITTDDGFIVIAATSRQAPVGGIWLEVKTPTRTEALKTAADGIAKTSIETGSIVVAAKSDEYAKIVENYEVIKSRSYILLLVLAVIVIGVVYLIGSSGKGRAAKPKEKGSKLATAHNRKEG